MTTFATPAPITATVQVAGARVRVNATDRTDTVVRVEPVDPSSRAHVKVADRTRVRFADGRLSVKTTASGSKDGSVAITIDLPAGSSLVTYLAHSTVQADGSFGECELHTTTSRVRLDRIDALQANFGSGELEIGRVAGSARIDGGKVAVRIGEAADTVELSTSGGPTWIGHARADLELTGGDTGFDIDRADGSVTAKTGNGAIRIGRLARGAATLWNGSGDIEVGIGAGTAARVHADSKKGSVRNTAPSPEQLEAFDEKVDIDARTRHGDIVIRPAAS
ncbi:hypothetical protein K3N28_14185 [Glycomyces sp. TRM65418]|uniref:DUF4097 family beta strand repeat-containing protein n=1 Tax=Glycomyces sp. TRM65418 TaxID=2867006 RepID=UPI001CE6EF90|nr:hypothetical protein [Glycomyces sp. TRM65418]MCC3764213.1 hypothetical protein [Glycomyces sp. TRM65418]QZD53897.1 hypothetical protein K3N28_14120 [Glycomyces sp. TRM65418]